MKGCDILEPYLENIFQKFYKEVLSDQYLKTLFKSEEQINELIEKQVKNLKETFYETDEEIKVKYYNLGNLHYDLKIPFVNLLSGVDFIKNEIYKILAEQDVLDLCFFQINTLFEKIKNNLAKSYLDRALEEISTGFNPEYQKFKFFNYHLQWLERLRDVAASLDRSRIPELDSRYCNLGRWFQTKEFELVCGEKKRCSIILELHELIHNTGKSLVFYIFHRKFVEAYLLFKTLNGLSLKIMNELYEIYLNYLNNREERFLSFLSKKLKEIETGYLSIINIRKLRAINEIYGKTTGDYILHVIEKVIKKKLMKNEDLLIKSISGEFLIFTEKNGNNLIKRLKDIKKHVEEYKDFPVNVKVSIGILEFPENLNLSPEDLMKTISILKDKSKQEENFYFANKQEVKEQILPQIKKQFEDFTLITRAISTGEVEVFFQTVVELKSMDIYGLEALVRIKKGNDYIPAGMFIEMAHKLGIIVDLDKVVLRKILEISDIISQKTDVLFINVSLESLKSESFIKLLTESIEFLKTKGIKVILELTEQSFLKNIDVIRFLHEEFGISFAVDDFGTGYSSLKTVIDLSESKLIEILKIDGSLIKEINTSWRNKKIVSLIVAMSKNLDIKTVAEYIENEELLNTIKNMGIEYGQGFGIGKPKPIYEIA
ncbi:EAL domain-containing protein [Persephonella sp. IF05-L8]|uniref:EAL domain-containing protein n=1 Tax=Persephonella sp. IF05-L8 TaxID=1158338 RepID=UPI0004977651